MDQRDTRALEIVEACLDREAGEREALIDARSAGDPALGARVREILAMEDAAEDLLPTGGLKAPLGLDDAIPDRIGKFRIAEVVARGGMGTVVRAERDDGLYTQTVAIKLIRADLADPQLAERFTEERRLLARLTHPSIARILDGGEEGGRPWLAMEFVEGVPVTEHIEARRAGIDEILDSFARVAEAVSHAHRNLVIHADIKPSNVTATAEGEIKLLDFGVGRLADRIEALPAPSAYPLTRAYAAPERLEGEPPSIAGDVYSLGVLLHELLAGTLPVPGTPLSALAGEGRVPPKLLRGDLDAIVEHALAAEPARRYPDVPALLADLRRFRERRPISVRPRHFLYDAQRYLRRNARGVALAAVVFVLLAGAAIVSFASFLEARQQRAAAEARFEQVRSLAKYQLFNLYDQLAGVPGTLPARSRLSAEAQRYLDQLASRPDAPAGVKLDTAAGYDRLAAILGVPNGPNMGQPARVLPNLDRALSLLEGLAAAAPSREVRFEQALNQLYRADYQIWQGNDLKAAAIALARADPLLAHLRDDGERWRELEAYRRQVHQDHLGWSERYAEERAFADATLRWLETWPAAARARPDWTIARARALTSRSEATFYLGDQARALADIEQADALVRAALASRPDHVPLLATRLTTGYNLVTTLEPMGRRAGLIERTAELVALARRARAFEPADRQLIRRARQVDGLYSQLLAEAGRHHEALAIQSAIVASDVAALRAAPGDVKLLRDLAFSRRVLGSLLWVSGERAEACGAWRQAVDGLQVLAARGTLNDWDRTNLLGAVRKDLGACGG